MRGAANRYATLLLCFAFGSAATIAGYARAAEVDFAVNAYPPREVGWFLGDRLVWRGQIIAPPGLVLDPASLPEAGPVDSFTEIRSVSVVSGEVEGGRRYELTLVYQSFYVPLEPKEVSIPAVQLAFRSEAGDEPESRAVAFPAWTIVLSPLRPILSRSSPDELKPDKRIFVIDTVPRQWTVLGAWTALMLLAALFLWNRGWGLRGLRRSRPLARALRAIRRDRSKGGADYATALVRLHRGLDETFGRRVLASDLEACLASKPHFQLAGSDLQSFFAASHCYFFEGDAEGAERRFPRRAIIALARQLARLERTI